MSDTLRNIASSLPFIGAAIDTPEQRDAREYAKILHDLEIEKVKLEIDKRNKLRQPLSQYLGLPNPQELENKGAELNAQIGNLPLTERESQELSNIPQDYKMGIPASQLSPQELANRKRFDELRMRLAATTPSPYTQYAMDRDRTEKEITREKGLKFGGVDMSAYANVPVGDIEDLTKGIKNVTPKSEQDMVYYDTTTSDISEVPKEGYQYIKRSSAVNMKNSRENANIEANRINPVMGREEALKKGGVKKGTVIIPDEELNKESTENLFNGLISGIDEINTIQKRMSPAEKAAASTNLTASIGKSVSPNISDFMATKIMTFRRIGKLVEKNRMSDKDAKDYISLLNMPLSTDEAWEANIKSVKRNVESLSGLDLSNNINKQISIDNILKNPNVDNVTKNKIRAALSKGFTDEEIMNTDDVKNLIGE